MAPAQKGSEKSELEQIFGNTPLFRGLPLDDLVDLEQLVTKKRFSRNQVILLEEDTLEYMYVIYSGKVKVIQTSLDGREHILAVHGRGDFFGEMGILDGKTSPATVVALEDAEIGLITRKDFDQYLMTKERFLKELILMLCSRLREAWLSLKVMSLTGAESRVRAVLKLIGAQHGIKDRRGTIIALKLTHRDIARHISLSRETVTRQLDHLLREGEIEILDDKRILLKPTFFDKSLFL
jgi:CRP/FNR family transcriptional regulator